MARYIVATVNEVKPGDRKIVEVAGRSLGIFNIQGEFFALRNRCPHQGGPLCDGRLAGFLTASVPGEYQYSRQGEILRCPWHGWEFDVRTGQSWFDPTRTRVRRYDAKVESGAVLVEEIEAAPSGLQKGPYIAETYSVSVEEEYVVVDVSN